jgi:putative lipoic acid-binding regulatory protein
MSEEELEKFRQKLVETTTFPTVYMFKIIVPGENRIIALVENLFEPEADIKTKESDKGKYISITVKQVIINVEEILEIYKKASLIKGVMML